MHLEEAEGRNLEGDPGNLERGYQVGASRSHEVHDL